MTIFVGGAHGVGKTHLAQPAAQRLGICYSTASQLIREERGKASWTAAKQVSEIDENQAALVGAVERILQSGEHLLLDGHLVLRREPFVHERLAEQVFRRLRCRRIIVVTAPTLAVQSRLKGRGDESWTDNEIAALVEAEVEHAAQVAASMAIPLLVLDQPDAGAFDRAVEDGL